MNSQTETKPHLFLVSTAHDRVRHQPVRKQHDKSLTNIHAFIDQQYFLAHTVLQQEIELLSCGLILNFACIAESRTMCEQEKVNVRVHVCVGACVHAYMQVTAPDLDSLVTIGHNDTTLGILCVRCEAETDVTSLSAEIGGECTLSLDQNSHSSFRLV